jgi:hypothetical protein
MARIYRLTVTKKKTVEEKLKAAQKNGFDHDMGNINDLPVSRVVLPYTTGLYGIQMELWRE